MKSKLFCFCLIFLLPVSVFALEGYKDLEFNMKKSDAKKANRRAEAALSI